MKRLFIYLLVFPLLFAACSKDEEVLPAQQKKIESFMQSSLRLVPEEEVEEGSRQAYYTKIGNSVYRYINEEDVYNPDRASKPEVGASSQVEIIFSNYLFEFSKIKGIPDGGVTEANFSSITMPFYSNDPAFIDYFALAGLTPGAWPFEPVWVDMAHPRIIKGLYWALLGCREGDRVQVYMSYDAAYGDDEYMYMIPKESPIAVFCTVKKVE